MFASAFVDYDNVCDAVKPEKGAADVGVNLEEFLRAFSAQANYLVPGIEAVSVRLYGGWINRLGQLTDRGSWVLSQLPTFRTRLNGVRIIPSMVRALSALPDNTLAGTYRPDLTPSQKMVDGMLTVDAISLAIQDEAEPILIVSDDDDFVPAAIASVLSNKKRRKIVLLRRQKPIGAAPNDKLLGELNITIGRC